MSHGLMSTSKLIQHNDRFWFSHLKPNTHFSDMDGQLGIVYTTANKPGFCDGFKQFASSALIMFVTVKYLWTLRIVLGLKRRD